ncbi:hypothetical protein [Roseitranquillus sediminis]|uniref:hypothetical protein n=1 Tax=Roseitranquillus sediminis TaxID=2809051 RepID=UPI001D0C3E6D|nr:hypothetical protein [Roseitranquillus sediminis]MBM9595990.1 hypothetical protein [Roseitranquillus sediminis]
MRPRVPSERSRRAVALTALASVGLVAGAAWVSRRRPPRRRPEGSRAARQVRQGAALLAGSVLADSTMEHYRGGFHNRTMFVAPVSSGLALVSALAPGMMTRRARQAVNAGAVGAGLAGHLFHLRNVLRRPGALSWESMFYAAPLGAPGAMTLAGLAGLAATRLETGQPRGAEALRAGRIGSLGTVAGLLGTTAEVALLHFRGAFHNPMMFAPVILPPLAALAVADAARRPDRARLRLARILLRATAAMGLAGAAFHAWGVHRNMGGWRNWRQNLQVAPPLPAPPSFTGVALAGLGAAHLLEEARR